MDFFRSVFSDEPDPPSQKPESESESSDKNQQQQGEELPDPNSLSNPNTNDDSGPSGVWSFGGLFKTLSSKSESVIDVYRRDLREFGSGIKKELEVAQGSLGTVSTVIDEFGNTVIKGTAEIISHGKDAILSADHESDSSDNNNVHNNSGQQKRYSRFEAQLRAIQGDVNTYCEEVSDLDDYKKWKSGFALDSMGEEIESLFEQNSTMDGIYKNVVPSSVDHETFWFRYFYRVFKLKQAEEMRVSLVKRAISREEDEDLSWDVDDDDEEENENNVVAKSSLKETENEGSKDSSQKTPSQEANVGAKINPSENKELDEKVSEKVEIKEESTKPNVEEVSKGSVAKVKSDDPVEKNDKVGAGESEGKNKEDLGVKPDEKASGKAESGESGKDSDISIVSTQPSTHEEEDLGWDEIEDLSSIDDKKTTQRSGSPNRAELRKRLSTAEEEEDLSWDIDDDDDPVKA